MTKELYDIVANVWVTADKATPIEKVACKKEGLTEKWFPMTVDYTILWQSPERLQGFEDIKAELSTKDISTIRYFITEGESLKGDRLCAYLSENKVFMYKSAYNNELKKFRAEEGMVITYDHRTMKEYQQYVGKLARRKLVTG